MTYSLLRLRLSVKGVLLLTLCILWSFAACRTQDPRPGLGHSGGNTSVAGDGDAGHGNSSGGVDFGVGEGGTNAAGGAATGEEGMGGSGGTTGPSTDPNTQCGGPPVSTGDFSKRRLLESVGACSAYQACLFSEAAFELGRRVTLYAGDPTGERLEGARAAWIEAAIVWSKVAPSQFGPVASGTKDSYHGRGIGALIHVWPAPNRCEVEKQVVNRGYEKLGFDAVQPSARGLSALEYLLFYEGSDIECSANSGAAQTWATLSAGEIAEAKRDYAKAVVQDLYLRAEELVNVWAEDGENFGETLANHDGYGSEQEALNVVAWSLLYPYEYVRDLKVAPLAGIGTESENPFAEYAHVDLESVVANIEAFRALFEGCGEESAGIGFDDWLTATGADVLRSDILQALDDIEAHAATLPPLHVASQEEMAAFYAELKVLSDLLKTQFFGSGSLLNLKLPAGAASDTD